MSEDPATWSTVGCPPQLVQEATLRTEALLTDAILRIYGIGEELAW
jgi:hypothetical protein